MSFGSSGGGGQTSVSRPATGAERGDVFNWGIKSIQNALGYSQPGYYTTTQVPLATQQTPNPFVNSALAGTMYKNLGVGNPFLRGIQTQQPQQQYTAQQVFTPTGSQLPFTQYTPWSSDALYDALLQARTAPLRRTEQLQREGLNQDLSNRGIWSSGLAGQLQNDLTEKLVPSYLQAGGEATTQAYQTAMEEKQRQYEALWRPLEFLMGLYNTTGGAFSTASGSSPSGFQFSI